MQHHQPVAHQPAAPAIGVLAEFAVPAPTTLVIKEKAFTFSGDDFAIKDSNGVVVCRVDGKAMSFSDSKDFIDSAGRPLFTVKKKLLSYRGSHEAYTPSGQLLFEVKGKIEFMGSRMIASFRNISDGRPLEIEVTGDWRDKKAEMRVVGTGQVVATVSRDYFKMREIFAGQQTYYVQVQPRVDLALIAALAVVFDERNNEK